MKPGAFQSMAFQSTSRTEAALAEAVRVGEELRDARLALGASLEEMGERLRINRRYLSAIEEGRSRELPGPAYALGFVRSYARSLGLDADDLARRYRDAGAAGPRARGDLVFPEPVRERGVPAGLVLLAGAVIMVGAYAAWWSWSGSAERVVDSVPPPPARLEPAPAPPTPAPGPIILPPAAPAAAPPTPPGTAGAGEVARPAEAPAAPAPLAASPGPAPPIPPAPEPTGAAPPGAPAPPPPAVAAAPEPQNRIALRATDESWVQIRDPRSGQVLLNRVLRPGETFVVPQREGLVLTTGRAQGLEVVVDGQASGVLAGRSGVVRDVALDPAALRGTTRTN